MPIGPPCARIVPLCTHLPTRIDRILG